MSILRVTVVRLHETPKFLLGQGREEELIKNFQNLADKYHRPMSLTLEKLEACGIITTSHSKNRFSFTEFVLHIRGLFATKKLALVC